MRVISLERSNLLPTAVVSLATFAALVLLGSVLAYWTWVWLAPRPEPRTLATMPAAGRVRAAFGLFGIAQRGRSDAQPTGIAIRLLGLIAASGGEPGYALLRLDAKRTVAVRAGGEIEPGVRLAEVHADHIVLERGGVRETLTWPKRGQSALLTAPLTGN